MSIFLQSSVGFNYLKSNGWIEKALTRWKDSYNWVYLDKLDRIFAEKLGYMNHSQSSYNREEYAYTIWFLLY